MSTLMKSQVSTSRISSSKPFSGCISPRPVKSVLVTRANAKEVEVVESVTKRQALITAFTASAALASSASPSYAFLGIGEDNVQDQYVKSTTDVLAKVQAIITLDRNDPTKDDQVKVLRKEINSWVATYRREPRVSGRPSYGNTYSALNTLAGHYNNFGTQAPIPKKRLERLNKEIADASLFLSKGR
ncbi:hypothetical protein CEUSTIGMA_g1913.t1 [Chlamydomonas eustigma]|uniref:Photosystem II Psb27 protein n=1 Tax=Chlamydomonas eustigma TaxID=1157962 RepID=A0A250WUF3_9CHLO|nr:hypothetical protein CEUSTIGMA_g1913.t1 [Chlamydomonas eustigma]|eukprot:GAX74464.1 hypothetical protein CEUSTIGMA_g1913.t1 [Chlamydomonas eustigma]